MSSRLKPEKTFAILMGCSRFEGFAPIPPVEKNLEDLQSLLADPSILGLPIDNIRTIPNKTCNQAIKLLKQYADQAKAAKASTLLFYYAGHGYRRTDGKYFLTATDSETDLINDINGTTGISFDDAIEKVLKQTNIHQHIIILDACSSGTVAQSDAPPLPEPDLKGSYTLTSSADRQESLFDEARCPHTFFTAELINTLRTGIANEKDTVTLTELHDDIKRRMKLKGYTMSPRQRTTDQLQAHTYTFCKNKAFDQEKKHRDELATEIQDALQDLEAGTISKAKRNLKGILEEIEEKITSEDYKHSLSKKVKEYLLFCENFTKNKPIFEKILGGDQTAALAAAQAELKAHTDTITQLKADLATRQKELTAAQSLAAAQAVTVTELEHALAQNQAAAARREKRLLAEITHLNAELAKTEKALQTLKDKYEPPAPSPAEAGFVFVQGGTFEMGDVLGDKEDVDETVHRVTLNDFYISQHAVTFAEYDRYCEVTQRDEPSDEKWGRDQRPVINVSWYDAVAYCNWLSEQHRLTPYYTIDKTRSDPSNKNSDDKLKWTVTPNHHANGYRLPTEAEWEYAAREGGKEVRFGNGKGKIDPKEVNFDASKGGEKPYSVVGEYREKTIPVGSLNCPNALGLHDMSGNVWEWCWDWFDNYPTGAQNNPQGAESGSFRVFRGGSWFDYAPYCRAADRSRGTPGSRSGNVGFRLVFVPQ